MKRTILVIIVSSSMGLAASMAFAGTQKVRATPSNAEIQQKAMRDGPSTGRIGYLTHREPAASHSRAKSVNPKLLRPLSQREIGMLYNACIAYPECVTAYSKAQEHNQALQRAQKAESNSGQ